MLWVKALGLASPLGGLVQASAAFRAGIARPAPSPDAEVMFPGDEQPQPVQVHALAAATFGFTGVGRLAALLTEALADLPAVPGFWAAPGAGLFLALPDPPERGFVLSGGGDEDEDYWLDDEDPEGAQARVDALGKRVLSAAARATTFALGTMASRFVGGGHVAFATALALARDEILARRMGSALVCAVDSLASEATVANLLEHGRVKTEATPTGFVPGEAAVVLLLESLPGRSVQLTGPLVRLANVAAATGDRPAMSETPSDARLLAACFERALGSLAPEEAAPLVVSDHDGEVWRAHELGSMRVRLAARDRRLADTPIWYPATSFGHTGTASGGVGLALAYRALRRGHSPAPRAVILSSADSGARAAALLTGESLPPTTSIAGARL
jgi:3-oxoacyl-[acyl-carrier-protein] synthase I